MTAPGDDIRMTMVVAEASYGELDRRGATLCRISRRLRETRPQFWCQKTDLLFYDFLIRLMCGLETAPDSVPQNGTTFGAAFYLGGTAFRRRLCQIVNPTSVPNAC